LTGATGATGPVGATGPAGSGGGGGVRAGSFIDRCDGDLPGGVSTTGVTLDTTKNGRQIAAGGSYTVSSTYSRGMILRVVVELEGGNTEGDAEIRLLHGSTLAGRLAFQSDGNTVIYDGGGAVKNASMAQLGVGHNLYVIECTVSPSNVVGFTLFNLCGVVGMNASWNPGNVSYELGDTAGIAVVNATRTINLRGVLVTDSDRFFVG
jgi:hypothetical protein